jgi:hypothetical protein
MTGRATEEERSATVSFFGFGDGHQLEFVYAQTTTEGDLQTGRSMDRITVLEDGRVRLLEEWEWTSQAGWGTSVLEEITASC